MEQSTTITTASTTTAAAANIPGFCVSCLNACTWQCSARLREAPRGSAKLGETSYSERVLCLAVPLLAERWRLRLQRQCGGRCEVSRQWCTVAVKKISVCVNVCVCVSHRWRPESRHSPHASCGFSSPAGDSCGRCLHCPCEWRAEVLAALAKQDDWAAQSHGASWGDGGNKQK